MEAAINAARGYLPTNLPSNPSYRKVNPAEQQIFQLALTSDVLDRGQLYDAASTIMVQKLSQIRGVGQVNAQGGALPGVRVELNPMALNKYGIGMEQVRGVLNTSNANVPKGHFSDGFHLWEVGRERSDVQGQGLSAAAGGLQQRRPGAAVGCRRRPRFSRGYSQYGNSQRPALGERRHQSAAGREHYRHGGSDSRGPAAAQGRHSALHQLERHSGSDRDHPCVGARYRKNDDHIGAAGGPGGVRILEKPPHHHDSERGRPRFPHRHVRCDVSAAATAWTISR